MGDPNKTHKITPKPVKTISMDHGSGRSNYVEVALGTTLAGRYRVTGKLGEGGMGVVYKGHDTQLQRDVAIKLLKRDVSRDERAVEKLKQEAQVAMLLTHPYIMRLINFERDGEYAFLLMEYVEGETLDALASLNEGKRLDEQLVGIIGYKVCEALEYAHDKNVIHRDIKPANIMMDKGKDSIKLMDFGIARMLMMTDDEKSSIAGTLAYIAPEVFEGARPDPRVDIYALGLTLYELLAGANPFQTNSAREIVKKHIEMKPPPLEGVDRSLAGIIIQCLEKKPNARFQTARELKNAFAKYLDLDEGGRVSRMKNRMEDEKRRMNREMLRLKREREKLESQRKNIERDFTRSRSRMNIPAPARTEERGGVSLSVMGVAVAAGVAAALAGELVSSGELLSFESEAGYDAAGAVAALVIMAAAPGLARSGMGAAAVGAMAGAALGYAGYLAADSYIDYSMMHDAWTPFSMISYLGAGVPLAVAASAAMSAGVGVSGLFRMLLAALAAVAVSSIVPYMGVAEDVLGLGIDSANYFYMPFLAVVVWGSVDFFSPA
ncbi:MAG: serine/threonine protein kinase [Candidatus Nitrospinota bacterium M3_3B_026]